MKILLDARLYGLEHAGIGRYLINLVDNLQSLDKKNKYTILLTKNYYEHLKLPHNWKKVLVDIPHYSLKEQLLLPRIIKKQNPDLVHFPHFNLPMFWKGKFIVTIHDMTMHFQKRNASKLPFVAYYLKRLPYKFIFRKAVTKSKLLIVPSEAVKNKLVDHFKIDKNKVTVIYEGVEKFPSQKNAEKILQKYSLEKNKYFFYVGNAFPHKNLKLVTDAVVQLNKKNKSDINFAVSSKRNSFTKVLERKHTKILGFVSDDELGVLYRNSIAFVYPSFSEGFGLQGLEAMNEGTLLLSSNLPVFKEIYKSNAFYFNPESIDSLLKSMEKVMSLTIERRNEHILKSKEFVKRYSWKNMAKKILQAYNLY